MACDADARLFRAVITEPGYVLQMNRPDARQIMTCALVLMGLDFPPTDDRNFIPRLQCTFQGYVLTELVLSCIWVCLYRV